MYTKIDNERFQYYSGKSADIRDARAESRRIITAETEREIRHRGDRDVYPLYDSRLISPYPGDSETYDYVFGTFARKGQNLKEYVESQFAHKVGSVIALDVGGPGSEAMNDFPTRFLNASFGMTLTDKRSTEKQKRDALFGHDVIPGDITAVSTPDQQTVWEKLDTRLGSKKIDVTFVRMGVGNEVMPQVPSDMVEIFNQVYRRTAANGLIFVQVPKLLHPTLDPWIAMINQDHAETLQVRKSDKLHGKYLEIKKGEGAPDKLPVLSPRTVRILYDTTFGKGRYADQSIIWQADAALHEHEPAVGASVANTIAEQEKDNPAIHVISDRSKRK